MFVEWKVGDENVLENLGVDWWLGCFGVCVNRWSKICKYFVVY